MPAALASSPAGSARPSASATSMASRAGSASNAAILEKPACTAIRLPCISARSMATLFEDLDAEPAPIDAMSLNETVSDIHHFHEVHLRPVRRRARILPHQSAAVGEKSLAVTSSQRRR